MEKWGSSGTSSISPKEYGVVMQKPHIAFIYPSWKLFKFRILHFPEK